MSKTSRQPASLIDCPFGVQLGGNVCSANNVGRDTGGLERFSEFASRQLAGTEHHVVDLDPGWLFALLAEGNQETLVVDTLVVDPAGTFEMGTSANPIATDVSEAIDDDGRRRRARAFIVRRHRGKPARLSRDRTGRSSR